MCQRCEGISFSCLSIQGERSESWEKETLNVLSGSTDMADLLLLHAVLLTPKNKPFLITQLRRSHCADWPLTHILSFCFSYVVIIARKWDFFSKHGVICVSSPDFGSISHCIRENTRSTWFKAVHRVSWERTSSSQIINKSFWLSSQYLNYSEVPVIFGRGLLPSACISSLLTGNFVPASESGEKHTSLSPQLFRAQKCRLISKYYTMVLIMESFK